MKLHRTAWKDSDPSILQWLYGEDGSMIALLGKGHIVGPMMFLSRIPLRAIGLGPYQGKHESSYYFPSGSMDVVNDQGRRIEKGQIQTQLNFPYVAIGASPTRDSTSGAL